jgi:hypothetical protein
VSAASTAATTVCIGAFALASQQDDDDDAAGFWPPPPPPPWWLWALVVASPFLGIALGWLLTRVPMMTCVQVPHYPRLVNTRHFLATHAARALRFSPLHLVGSLATCPACGDLIREYRGHVAGRCTFLPLHGLLLQPADSREVV